MREWWAAKRYRMVAAIAAATAFLFAILPQDWIEQRFGIDPDAGNGSLERFFVALALAVAVTFAAAGIMRLRQRVPARRR